MGNRRVLQKPVLKMKQNITGVKGTMSNRRERRERLLMANETAQQAPRGPEKKKSPGKIIRNIFLGIIFLCLLIVIGFYASGMMHFKDKFFMNTRINGVDVSEMTVDQVEEMVAQQIGPGRWRL